jgi:YVTN family beta-propeller protein
MTRLRILARPVRPVGDRTRPQVSYRARPVVGVAVDPAAGTVYVANEGDNTVSVIDEATGAVTGTIPVGPAPEGVAVDPATGTVYVANESGNTVSVIGRCMC